MLSTGKLVPAGQLTVATVKSKPHPLAAGTLIEVAFRGKSLGLVIKGGKVCACVYACVRVCVRVCACVHRCVHVFCFTQPHHTPNVCVGACRCGPVGVCH